MKGLKDWFKVLLICASWLCHVFKSALIKPEKIDRFSQKMHNLTHIDSLKVIGVFLTLDKLFANYDHAL